MAQQVITKTVAHETPRGPRSRHAHLAILAAVFAVAFVARLLPVLLGGGLRFYGRYDDGVYYTAAESLSFGHVPYRDFVLLHPPGIMLALLPFTLLGRLTSDPIGMAAGRVAFMAVGALNAVVVAAIASRWGWTRGAFAGLLYAASAAAIYDEESTFLEPLATLFVLVAVLALYRRTARSAVRLELIAGVALGLACCMKIWYAPVLLTVVLVIVLRREVAAAARILVAGAIAAAVVLVPFLLAARGQMWTMVVKDQLGRPPMAAGRLIRIPRMLGISDTFKGAHSPVAEASTVVLVALFVVALAFCLADRDTWLIAGLSIVAVAILMASPSYFRHYGVLLAPPMALLLAVGLGKALLHVRAAPARVLIGATCAALVLASGVRLALEPTGRSFPADAFAAAAPAGCIASDDPAAMIQMNRLSQDLRSHCDVPVDVTGASYGTTTPRAYNPVFQTWLMHHLTNSAAFVVLRPGGDPLSPKEKVVLRHYRLLASGKGVALRTGDGR